MSTLIFIDGSYYIFYRYYALLNWWKFQIKMIKKKKAIVRIEKI